MGATALVTRCSFHRPTHHVASEYAQRTGVGSPVMELGESHAKPQQLGLLRRTKSILSCSESVVIVAAKGSHAIKWL